MKANTSRPTDPAECRDLIVDSVCPGVLGDSDRVAALLAADLLAKHNAHLITAAERQQLISRLARFGMTPADRARISVPAEYTDNPYAQLDRDYPNRRKQLLH